MTLFLLASFILQASQYYTVKTERPRRWCLNCFKIKYIDIKDKHALPVDIEFLFIELNFWESKWLSAATYYLPDENDQ